MSRKNFTLLLLVVLFIFPAYAFKIHYISVAGKAIHEEITKEAIGSESNFKVYYRDKQGLIRAAEIAEDFLIELKEENTENDEMGLDDGTLHFDDSRIHESGYHAYTLTDAAIQAIKNGSSANECRHWIYGIDVQCDGNPVAANLGAATHTVQDFFAHSTWVETNVGLGAFSGEKNIYLNPLSDHIPIPKIGIMKSPFSDESFTSTHNRPNDVEVRSNALGTDLNDDVDGHCSDTGYNAVGNKQITTAYYDYRMSILPTWPESGPLMGSKPSSWKTDVWNGFYQATDAVWGPSRYPFDPAWILHIGSEKINWPKKRCIHGDELVGINKDSPVASGSKANAGNHERATKAAATATRNLVMHFINESNVLNDPNISEDIRKRFFVTYGSVLPEIRDPILIPYPEYTDGRLVEYMSGGEVYGFNFKARHFSVPANMLNVKFGDNSCEMIDESISKNFKGNKTHYFVCYQNKPGTLNISQKSNESIVLYQAKEFPFDRVSMSSDWLVGQSVTIVINNISEYLKTVKYFVGSYFSGYLDGKKNVDRSSTDNSFSLVIDNILKAGKYQFSLTLSDFEDANYYQRSSDVTVSLPTATITGAKSDTATQPGEIADGGSTNDTTPTLRGGLNAPLTDTQHVNIYNYDYRNQFVAYANVIGTNWTFTPATPLASGSYRFRVDVSDGVAGHGSISDTYVINISASPASPFTDVGQNNGFNNPTLETVYEIKKIGLDTSDGTLRLPLTVGEVDSTFPYIWIANSGEGTISKLATRDHYRKSPQTGEQELVKVGQELGRYRTGPGNGNPSRTTVDQDGNVWVGNRDNNTITKVGLFEFGNCIDRNGNGKIDTSAGKDDLKDWGGSFGDGQGFVNALDECVLQHVNLQAEGVDTPTDIRLIAIDKDNNVFAGGTNRQSIFKVNGSTGQIIKGAMTNGSFYGGLIDKNNNLWAASRITGYGMVHKVSNDLNNSEIISANLDVYGIALDKYGKIWVTNAYAPNFATFNPADIAGTLTVFSQQGRNSGGCYAQGVAVDDNDNIFIAGGHRDCNNGAVVGHYKQLVSSNSVSIQFVANYQVSSGPTGVAVDGNGNVWSTDLYNNAASRITLASNPDDAKIDTFPVGLTPYNYSDMTGRTVRNITNRQGTWEAIFDGGVLNFEWKKLVWSLKNQLPRGTAVAAYAKTANAKVDLGGKLYQQVENNLPLSGMKGQFIKVKFVLTSADSKSTPEITGIDFQ